jgi:hypothetical protein
MGLDLDSRLLKYIFLLQFGVLFMLIFCIYMIMSKTSKIANIIDKQNIEENIVKNLNDNEIYIEKESIKDNIEINQKE